MLLNRRRVLRASLLMLAAAALLTVLVTAAPDVPQIVDDRFAELMRDLRWQPAVRGLEAISLLGATAVSWSLRAAAVLGMLLRRRYLQLTAFVGAVITSELCIGPLKALIDRPRPPGALVSTTHASYPSGHAIAISVTAVGLVVALLPPGRRRLRWEIGATVICFFAALSRTYLSAHWLTDVIGGTLIGGGLALLWPAVLEEWRARVRHEDHDPALAPETKRADTEADIPTTSPAGLD